MNWTPPYPTNEMLALSDKGVSSSEIGRRFNVTRNAVTGRVARARVRLAKENPTADLPTDHGGRGSETSAQSGEVVVSSLIAGNTAERGAHLDSLIWSRRSYLANLKAEGGV